MTILMRKREMFSYSKNSAVKAKSNFPISLSQSNQLPITCLSFKKWFMLTQALCVNVFPTEKGIGYPIEERFSSAFRKTSSKLLQKASFF